jgi:hypothetical protein
MLRVEKCPFWFLFHESPAMPRIVVLYAILPLTAAFQAPVLYSRAVTSRTTVTACRELPSSGTKLDEFLTLLGRCYAGAGVAHAVDFATANALPAAAGLVPYTALPPAGQAMGVLWCLLGMVQPLATSRSSQETLAIAYGVYEIILTLAASTLTSDPDGTLGRLGAAAGLQAVVYFCYVELRRQSVEITEVDEQRSSAGKRRAPELRMLASKPPTKGSKAGARPAGKKVSKPTAEPRSVQQQLEDQFGEGAVKSFVILTGVLCYPLMAYGIAMKQSGMH